MRKPMPKGTKKMGPGAHKMPITGMTMTDSEMKAMMTPPKKRKGAKVKKGY